ncbi:MAG: formyltetrahydrofolate deformylase [Pseudomonadales bacterium]|nr:formyltetrahydrofolate deformylase [Pseudomonadales bacterium]
MAESHDTTARLLITCPDKPGIVSAVSTFFFNHGANITALDQYSTDPEGGTFFTRLEFQTLHLDIGKKVLMKAFSETVAKRYDMDWRISYSADVKKVAVLVSKHDHGLLELLWRWSRGELPAEISMVISNHETLKEAVLGFGLPFHYVPVNRDTKVGAEQQILTLIEGQADLVVLARYMQVLSAQFVSQFENRIINIHHSFLPSFVGADPYQQAHDKGVKIIGATSHYVTSELDMGPIIDQSILRVSHRDTVQSLREKGKDIERNVLARAVRWHLEDRIIVHGNKTIVFD